MALVCRQIGMHADRERTKPLPKPRVELFILCKVVKATPAAVAKLLGSMVQPLLAQVPRVTFLSSFFPSKALPDSTACMALYCTILCRQEHSESYDCGTPGCLQQREAEVSSANRKHSKSHECKRPDCLQ